VALAAAAFAGFCAVGAGAARAGTYEVKTCLARGAISGSAYILAPRDITNGMGIARTCRGDSERKLIGVVTGERGSGTRPRGSRAILKLLAPAGTRITSVAWRGDAQRTDCGWEMAVYAADGPRVVRTIQKVSAGIYRNGQICPRRFQPQVARTRRLRYEAFPEGATRLVQRIVCRGFYSRRCSARGANYIRTLASRVTIEDKTPPSVQITGGSLLGGWVSKERELQFSANDAVGVQNAVLLDERGRAPGSSTPRTCDFSSPTPCPNGPGLIKVDTRDFAREGTQRIDLRAVDAAGNTGAVSAEVHVDNTPPPRVDPTVRGGDAWRRSNGFAVDWQNAPEADRAPVSAAYYRICRADGTDCSSAQRREGAGIGQLDALSVPAPGEWNLTMWREDQAGNVQPDNASAPAKLRYDPDPPQIAFEPPAPSDPTRVALAVKEEVSGLATGRIEMGKEGSGVWRDLPVQRQGGDLVGRVDDSKLEAGRYLVRASVSDQAGNQAATDRRADGSPMVLTLPLRIRSEMRSGIAKKRLVRIVVRRHGKRRKVRRRVTRLVDRARVRLGRVVRISGRLADAGGRPLVGQTVYVGGRGETEAEHFVGTVTTNSRGKYSYLARASRNAVFRFVYLGTATVLPVQREVTLLVPARTTLRAGRHRVLNGQSVTFRGRLRSMPIPPGGKLVELQVRLTGHWQTFRTVLTDGQGRWSVSYKFRRTVGVQRYNFRARLPREAGYPFQSGRSRTVAVRVRGGR
jgi:hypothetical protein